MNDALTQFTPIERGPFDTLRLTKQSARPILPGNHAYDTESPWKHRDTTYEYGIVGFHKEIKDFCKYFSPTIEEQTVRELVVFKVKNVICGLWPDCQVDVFGSFKTGLYLPTSDIDMVIFGKWKALPLHTLQRKLLETGIASHVKVLDKATVRIEFVFIPKVPIIKMTEKETQVHVDISFNMVNSVHAADLINKYIQLYPCLPYLVFVLKQFLFQRDLNEVWTGGLSSYALILMLVRYLQDAVIRNTTIEQINLGTLLLEFFELYGRAFNYTTTAIRVKDEGSFVRKDSLVFGHKASILCIEDPLCPTNDVGKRSYAIYQIKQAFDHAFVALSNAVLPQFCRQMISATTLSRIIHISQNVITCRRGIQEYAHRLRASLQLTMGIPTVPVMLSSAMTPVATNLTTFQQSAISKNKDELMSKSSLPQPFPQVMHPAAQLTSWTDIFSTTSMTVSTQASTLPAIYQHMATLSTAPTPTTVTSGNGAAVASLAQISTFPYRVFLLGTLAQPLATGQQQNELPTGSSPTLMVQPPTGTAFIPLGPPIPVAADVTGSGQNPGRLYTPHIAISLPTGSRSMPLANLQHVLAYPPPGAVAFLPGGLLRAAPQLSQVIPSAVAGTGTEFGGLAPVHVTPVGNASIGLPASKTLPSAPMLNPNTDLPESRPSRSCSSDEKADSGLQTYRADGASPRNVCDDNSDVSMCSVLSEPSILMQQHFTRRVATTGDLSITRDLHLRRHIHQKQPTRLTNSRSAESGLETLGTGSYYLPCGGPCVGPRPVLELGPPDCGVKSSSSSVSSHQTSSSTSSSRTDDPAEQMEQEGQTALFVHGNDSQRLSQRRLSCTHLPRCRSDLPPFALWPTEVRSGEANNQSVQLSTRGRHRIRRRTDTFTGWPQQQPQTVALEKGNACPDVAAVIGTVINEQRRRTLRRPHHSTSSPSGSRSASQLSDAPIGRSRRRPVVQAACGAVAPAIQSATKIGGGNSHKNRLLPSLPPPFGSSVASQLVTAANGSVTTDDDSGRGTAATTDCAPCSGGVCATASVVAEQSCILFCQSESTMDSSDPVAVDAVITANQKRPEQKRRCSRPVSRSVSSVALEPMHLGVVASEDANPTRPLNTTAVAVTVSKSQRRQSDQPQPESQSSLLISGPVAVGSASCKCGAGVSGGITDGDMLTLVSNTSRSVEFVSASSLSYQPRRKGGRYRASQTDGRTHLRPDGSDSLSVRRHQQQHPLSPAHLSDSNSLISTETARSGPVDTSSCEKRKDIGFPKTATCRKQNFSRGQRHL